MIDTERLDRAEDFMRRNARLIDRRRFAFHFRGGPAAAIVAALRPYENPDGGYGHALEPDLRGEGSQPVPAQHALEFLHEAGADDDPAVTRLCDHLATISRGGGVPFVLPSVREAPHAPWWQTPDDPPGNIVPTGTLAGQLHRIGSAHPWLGPATEFCWSAIDAADDPAPYEIYAILAFLDHVPDRDRAEAAFERLRKPMLQQVALDPNAPGGDVHFPLDFAPAPDGFGRRLFSDETIEEHLDALVEAQREDGGWTVNFLIWTPKTEPEWRGHVTVERLKTLRAYGRLAR